MTDAPSLNVKDAEVRVHGPSGPVPRTYQTERTFTESVTVSATEGDPLQTFAQDVIESINTTAREGREVGTAEIVLRRPGLAVEELVQGRQLFVEANTSRTAGVQRLARLRLEDFSISGARPGPTTAELEARNWVFATLSGRRFTGRIRDERLDDAVERMLTAAAPEVVLQNNLTNPPTVSETFDSVPLREAIARLLDDQALMVANDNALILSDVPTATGTTTFRESRTFASSVTFDGTTGGDDLIEPERSTSGGDLATRVRLDGGDLSVPLPTAARPQRDEYRTVDQSTRLVTQLDALTAEIDSLELATRHAGSDANLVVRLHPNEDGEPADPDNIDRDLATNRLNGEFVDEDGLTSVEFAEHTISEARPFVLVELEASGQATTAIDLGGTVDNGEFVIATPSVTARRPLVLTSESPDAADRHGRRDIRIQRDSIASLDEAERVADRILSQRDSPSEEIEGRANGPAQYDISVLDARDVDFPDLAVSEPFVVTGIEEELVGARLFRTLTLRQPAGFDP